MILSHDAVVFCLVSFEGPDPYSLAGGPGVRLTNLAETRPGAALKRTCFSSVIPTCRVGRAGGTAA